MPEIGFPSCEIEKENFRDSQGKQIWTKDMESFESKVMKQSNVALQLLLLRWFRKLPKKLFRGIPFSQEDKIHEHKYHSC